MGWAEGVSWRACGDYGVRRICALRIEAGFRLESGPYTKAGTRDAGLKARRYGENPRPTLRERPSEWGTREGGASGSWVVA
jgi:hypothetical protein